MSKRLVATHNKVTPSMVTAENLVRTLQICADAGDPGPIFGLAKMLGFYYPSHNWLTYTRAIEQIAIAIIESTPTNTITGTLNGQAATFEVVYRGD